MCAYKFIDIANSVIVHNESFHQYFFFFFFFGGGGGGGLKGQLPGIFFPFWNYAFNWLKLSGMHAPSHAYVSF